MYKLKVGSGENELKHPLLIGEIRQLLNYSSLD